MMMSGLQPYTCHVNVDALAGVSLRNAPFVFGFGVPSMSMCWRFSATKLKLLGHVALGSSVNVYVTVSKKPQPHVLFDVHVRPLLHCPHCPPQPLSPHCLPPQLGVHVMQSGSDVHDGSGHTPSARLSHAHARPYCWPGLTMQYVP